MQNTDKPKLHRVSRTLCSTKASAPETRTSDQLANARKHLPDIDATLEAMRTIPAEKPTAIKTSQELPEINWVAIAESNAKALEQSQAHAANLAEALRTLTHAVEQGRWIAFETCVACSQKALAACEESRQ